MTLPLLDTFSQPYEIWSKRKLTPEDLKSRKYNTWEIAEGVNDKLDKTISSALDAAHHMAQVGVDSGLAHFIEDSIESSREFKIWRSSMPSRIPPNIKNYQNSYPNCDFEAVNSEIQEIGCLPSEEQCFFHGGYIFEVGINELSTCRPLSTTLCPEVALREATHNGKAFHQGEIHLYVLKVVQPQTKVYVFRQNGSKMGYEKEILLAAGAKLKVESKSLINESYPTGIYESFKEIKKDVPVYVIEVSVS
ncbi:hypothetical protein [Acinetobacter soli]|uniref:hypothetical protein n=1 Tax=Acinetobacter soli TaxID=487316 RepID=UPI00301A8AC4